MSAVEPGRTMFLVQILLPLYDNHGQAFGAATYRAVALELAHDFGGSTAYTRAPAEGRWKDADEGGRVQRDDVLIFEVMVDALDRAWWARYRAELERRFAQDEIVVRAHAIERL